MYCKKCGAQINDDAVFCEKCGAKQGSSTSTQHTSSPAQSEPQEKKMTPEEIIKDFDGNLYDAIKYLALRDGISMVEA